MAWTKDSESEAPKIIYTDSERPQRIIYDPNATADKRITVEMEYLTFSGEAITEIESALGI